MEQEGIMKTVKSNNTLQRYKNAANNAQGAAFEGYIKEACKIYSRQGKAEIDKTPEPFRVISKNENGVFTGRFTAPAQPDFQGTLDGGRSIVFEAKYTSTDKLRREILTETQMETLEHHSKLGAISGICAGISDKFYFIPWIVWRDMKIIFKRQYATPKELEYYRVKFTGALMFLDYINIIKEL